MLEKLKLGVIGMSDGNGHPYSWSAIMNGYSAKMDQCPFPAIPEYLKQHSYPADFIGSAEVTHVWTQDLGVSKHIAESANIINVCQSLNQMLNEVDGVLLARDDAENHMKFAEEAIRMGLPIYIDKPVAHSLKDFNKLLLVEQYEGQIFTCSALRYADELMCSSLELSQLGELRVVRAVTPKSWEKYAVHIIEPIITQMGGISIENSRMLKTKHTTQLTGVNKDSIVFDLSAVGETAHPILIEYIGAQGRVTKVFTDSFNAFKKALEAFIDSIRSKQRLIDIEQTRSIVRIIEQGLNY